jgi:glutathione S-transferase
MQNLQLISHRLCPYVQRAAIVLAEKGTPFERRNIDLAQKPDWFLKLSPLGKVPVLLVQEHGRQEVIFESAVIAEYLDETIEPRLHPQEPLARARHRAWIEFASATLADIAGFYTAVEAEQFTSRSIVLEGRFARLEDELGHGPWFGGTDFSIVDAAFAPVFRYFDVFDTVIDHGIFEGKPKLQVWRAELRERPSVRGAVSADYGELLREFVLSRGSHLAGLVAVSAEAGTGSGFREHAV